MPPQYFAHATPAGPWQVLDARERRAETQRELLARFRLPLVSFTLNIPGAYKRYPLAERAFREGAAQAEQRLGWAGISIRHRVERADDAGFEAFLVAEGDASTVKELLVALEETHPLGRLFDLDVLAADGTHLHGADHGRGERRCLICGGPVWACARSRAHPPEQLARHAAGMIEEYFHARFADRIAGLALRALLYEVAATPKPGLVDRQGNGAHRDMDFFTFVDSGCALIPYFRDVTLAGLRFEGKPGDLLPALRPLGRHAEEAMLAATGGVNTHRGLIFSLGLVCAATGSLHANNLPQTPDTLLEQCAVIAGGAPAELHAKGESHGRAAFARYGVTGVRGEAAAGFPAVRDHGFPALRRCMALGCSLNDAAVASLLYLLAHVDDTNVIARADLETLHSIRRELRARLARDPDPAGLVRLAHSMDNDFIRLGLSPGGCADLLALSLMLWFLFEDAGSEPPADL